MRIQVLKFIILAFGFLNVNLLFASVNPKTYLESDNKKAILKTQPYSFRPLLIQGKKELGRQIQEMKLETGAVIESEVFFIDQDFKKRIFIDEGFSQ